MQYALLLYMVSFLVLFSNFYLHSYIMKRKSGQKSSPISDPDKNHSRKKGELAMKQLDVGYLQSFIVRKASFIPRTSCVKYITRRCVKHRFGLHLTDRGHDQERIGGGGGQMGAEAPPLHPGFTSFAPTNIS